MLILHAPPSTAILGNFPLISPTYSGAGDNRSPPHTGTTQINPVTSRNHIIFYSIEWLLFYEKTKRNDFCCSNLEVLHSLLKVGRAICIGNVVTEEGYHHALE
ncbi:hypothetical protein KY290_029501 [Solanum tuberosum]|uniref:Uncharacterized protein n=1 Tax=Solanum tuberosum TaxID=4113 RepID=A0ABQ7UKX9_SOLTU|nr:hypothetical protein KY284_028504 [Solanum tuberosum]KAH0667349.1 hypothetical protein KY285_028555 [Solanum tuberosum]KAH0750269.1 hypothetical protein KY290_029501 [Solanum tuberosum]